ncbi:MAG: hypothetical protein H2042_01020 [Rhizobiales bacterium]|nr:hypothetical protein [Hyphomicrobiales bacterium]
MTSELDAETVRISRQELREIVREEASAAVRGAFDDIGLYADDPEERREVREDFRHLRKWREATDALATKVGNAVLLALTSDLLVLVWIGFKTP